MDYVINSIIENIKIKNNMLKIDNEQIKKNLFIFINFFMENPMFDSLTREYLFSNVNKFNF